MKNTTVAVAILFSLAGTAPVLAEMPAAPVIPLTMEVDPIDVDAPAQQAVAETLPAAVEEALSDLAAPAAGFVEAEAASEMPEVAEQPALESPATEAAAAGAAMVEEQVSTETSSEDPGTGTAVAEEYAGSVETQAASEMPEVAEQPALETPAAEAAAAGATMVEEQVSTKTSSEDPGTGTAAAEEQTAAELPVQTPAVDAASADVQTGSDAPAEMAAPDTAVPAAGMSGNPCPKHGMGMGMMHRHMGADGEGMAGKMPGYRYPGMGMKGRQEQVVQRLDMIEARMAKIEAMLESLMKHAQEE